MSWEPCIDCKGKKELKDNCKTCHGNGGAFAMAPEGERDTLPAPPPADTETSRGIPTRLVPRRG